MPLPFCHNAWQCPVLLQPRREVLNEMPLLVDMAVIPALSFARPNTGNDNLLALAQQWFNHAFMGVIRFVGNHGLRVGARKPDICTFKSDACPAVRWKPVGLPRASTVAWILVLKPPRLRPMAWLCPLLHPRCADGHARWLHRSWRTRYQAAH